MATNMGNTGSFYRSPRFPRPHGCSELFRRNRRQIEAVLSKNWSISLIQDLVKNQIIDGDVNQINKKATPQAKAASILDKVINKGTQREFLELVREDYPILYSQFQLKEDGETFDSVGTRMDNIRVVMSECIRDRLSSLPSFNKLLRKSDGIQLHLLTFANDFKLMHQIIQDDRPEFLKAVLYSGQWDTLFSQRVGSENAEHYGKTPLELSVALGRYKCTEALNMYQKLEQSLSAAVKAVRGGDITAFEVYQSRVRQSVLYQSSDGCTLLDYACQSGSKPMLEKVIKTLRARTSAKVENALCICVEFGYPHLLHTLKEYAGSHLEMDSVKIEGKLLIEKSAMNGDVETYRELIGLGARITYSIVSLAVSENRLDFIRALLHDPLWARLVNFKDKRQKSAAHFAAEKGFREGTKLLLDNGADLLATDKRGYTILHSAALGGSADVINIVIAEGKKRKVNHLLLNACDQYIGSERCFLLRGKDGEDDAWHYVEVDRALIDLFRKKSRSGQIDVTFFGSVMKSGWGVNPSADVVREIEERYDVMKIRGSGKDDMTALHLAILKNHEQGALSIIEEVENVGAQDCFGLTPLHLAAMRGNTRIIEALLAKGASLVQQDHKGRTAMDIAQTNEHPEAAVLLNAPATPENQLQVLRSTLLSVCNNISDQKITALRQEKGQEEANRHIRDMLREANADINDYLFEIGFGPVASECDSRDNAMSESYFG